MGNTGEKSKAVALILWFFLGAFGAHRFYLGKTGTGVLCILTTILSSVLLGVGLGTVQMPLMIIGGAILGVYGIILFVDLIRIITGGLLPASAAEPQK